MLPVSSLCTFSTLSVCVSKVVKLFTKNSFSELLHMCLLPAMYVSETNACVIKTAYALIGNHPLARYLTKLAFRNAKHF